MSNIIKNSLILTTGIAIGGAAGYFVTKKALQAKYELEVDEQIRDVKEYYRLLRKDLPIEELEVRDEKETVNEKLVQALKTEPTYSEMIVEYAGDDEPEESEEPMIEEPEDEERDPSKPYIISIEEYMQDRPNYDKNTLTYFEEDDVTCDERESVIPDAENVIGTEALTRFGDKSKNENAVYVRNEELEADFEILLDKRSYSEVVLGFKEEKEVRRMREDD